MAGQEKGINFTVFSPLTSGTIPGGSFETLGFFRVELQEEIETFCLVNRTPHSDCRVQHISENQDKRTRISKNS